MLRIENRDGMLIVIVVGIILVGLVCGCSETPEDADVRIIFRSAMHASMGDPDFQANPQRHFEQYTMNVDGSNIQRITR